MFCLSDTWQWRENVVSWQWSRLPCFWHMKGQSLFMWHSLKSISFPRKEILCMSLDNQFQEQHSGPNIFFPFIIVLSPSWKYLSSWFCIALNVLSISHKNFCNFLQFLFFCHALYVNIVSEWDKSDILHQETKSLGLMISLGQGAQYPDRCFS